MLALKILLIPFKLMIKLIGYLIVAVLKIIGWFIKVIGAICGIVTSIIGVIAVLASVAYLVLGFMNFIDMKEIDYWWVAGVVGCIFGAVVFSMGIWAEYVGDFLSDLGSSLSFSLSNITFFE